MTRTGDLRRTSGDEAAEAVFRLSARLVQTDQVLGLAVAALHRGDLAGGAALVEHARRALHGQL